MTTETTETTSEAPEAADNATPEDVETIETEDNVSEDGDEGTGDADNPDGAPEEDDSEEFEFEGVKAKVPKALAEAIAQGALRRADYSQKTEALARQREAMEARETEIATRAEVEKANVAKVARLHLVEADLKVLDDVTPEQWEAIKSRDKDEYRDLKDQHRDLKDEKARLQGELDAKVEEAKRQAEETSTKEFTEARTAMGRALFGIDKAADGPDLAIPGLTPKNAGEVFAKIETFATKSLGITPAELAKVTDARILKGLHMAMQAVQAASTKKAAEQVATTQKTAPARNVTGAASHARRASDKSGDGLSTEEWMRRRNEELRAKSGRR